MKESASIIKFCENSIAENGYICFPENKLKTISDEEIILILDKFSGNAMMLLPQKEISFFEWLKQNDEKVWLDIWQDDIPEYKNKYIVSIDFLPLILNKDGRGYPICDLQTTENYYFTKNQMIDQESEIIIEAARELFKTKKKMTLAQILALEISMEPIDIWHFAYKYNVSLEEAKAAVDVLVSDGALVHLKEAEHISSFINF